MRVDHALYEGLRVPTEYDPLLAKIVVYGMTRDEALVRARRAARETIIAGLPTCLSFHLYTLDEPDFAAGSFDTNYIATHWPPRDEPELEQSAAHAAALVAVLARRGARGGPRTAVPGTARLSAGSDWLFAAREDALR